MAVTTGSVEFVGTATCLIRYADFVILTDPNFLHQGERISLGFGLHATRLTEPSMRIEDLPALDLLVLSHMHEDHFDRLAAKELARSLPIATPPSAAVALRRHGFENLLTFRTWESRRFDKHTANLRLTAMPARHGPGLVDWLMPEVMGSILEFEAEGTRPFRIYISGDTLLHPAFYEIAGRYPNIDLALLHLGGTRIAGVLLTMDGRQGARAFASLRPRIAIPIHYDDYDIFHSPLDDFKRAIDETGFEDRVHYLERGQRYEFTVREAASVPGGSIQVPPPAPG